MTNSYVFYEVANSYELVRPHSYDFVLFLWGVGLGAGLGVVICMNSYKFDSSLNAYDFSHNVLIRMNKFVWISHTS